jgi:cysteine-rich repeat protein
MSRLNAVVLGAALSASLGGCNVFDAKLWMDAVVPADAAVPDAAAEDTMPPTPDAAEDTMPPAPDTTPMVLTDRCEDSMTITSQGGMTLAIDTTGFKNDYSELAMCTGHDLPGNDGFVTVQMAAGEKWHVHVTPLTPGFDPAIYILSSCDPRACSPITATDECGPNKSEHLSFIAPETGMYKVGIDSMTGGGMATMALLRPTCGNGMVEHSETCDDGNTTSGDGCDSLCRKELAAANVSETEPNDDPRAANVVLGADRPGGTTVTGTVASRCDHDMYSVTVPPMTTLRATLSATAMPCNSDGVTIKLLLLSADGQTPVNANLTATNDCPALEATNLPPGEYFLVVRRPGGDPIFPYQLMVETPAVMP